MIITRRLRLKQTWPLVVRSIAIGSVWAAVVFGLYAFIGLEALRIPFLPLSTIGTAVAFYVGLKNNASYDRFWEGRKIWGGVVNVSRTFAASILSYVEPASDAPGKGLSEEQKRIVYRHLAWINALRIQLRRSSRFENQPARSTALRLKNHGKALRMDWEEELSPFLDAQELTDVSKRQNSATHLLARQAEELAQLQRDKRLNIFHHTELMNQIEEMYALQGKSERIKNTPFPRQYAEFSRLFTNVFCFFVPFGLLDVFGSHIGNLSELESYLPAIPMIAASALITWVYQTLEGVGDASEDPFEQSMNDVPLNALCRTIEIDLRELLGETDLPPKEAPANFAGFDILY